jgi:hypothetical protein
MFLGFDRAHGHRAQQKAGITPPLAQGEKRKAARDRGMHALRQTAACAWLSAGPISWPWPHGSATRAHPHLMPATDNRGREAMDRFFRRPGREESAPDVPSDGAQ